MVILISLLICSVIFACCMAVESKYHLKMWRSVHRNNLDLSEHIRVLEERYHNIPTIVRNDLERWDNNLTK